jgi:phospholipid/cholesterol/gamma-HCH transport system substrate-binding protein
MITRFVRIQLVIFVIVGITFSAWIVLGYVGLGRLFGTGQMDVTVKLDQAGGLYPNANVTYRGVTIGRILSMDATLSGVEAVARIPDSEKIPANANAAVQSMSAIGEQYLDLVPSQDTGPYLHNGSVIQERNTSTPLSIGTVLQSVNSLLASLPTNDLNTVINEAYNAFDGSGPNLQRLLVSLRSLVADAQQNYGSTSTLINGVGPLLNTQLTSDTAIRTWAGNLASFSGQLRQSDQQIRTLLDQMPPAASAVTGLVQKLSPTLPVLLNNTDTVGQLLKTYRPALQQLLIVYPLIITAEQSASPPGNGHMIGLDLELSVNDPGWCEQGYPPPSDWVSPSDTSEVPTPADTYCKVAHDSTLDVRGAHNYPCLVGVPGRRAATPQQCGASEDPATDGSSPSGSSAAGSDGPLPGLGGTAGPDGPLSVLGGIGDPALTGKEKTWQTLLIPDL